MSVYLPSLTQLHVIIGDPLTTSYASPYDRRNEKRESTRLLIYDM